MSYAELVDAVKRSRGWFRRISSQSGCRLVTLRQIANNPAYDPSISEVEKIWAWYREHGVPERHPLAGSKEAASAAGPQ